MKLLGKPFLAKRYKLSILKRSRVCIHKMCLPSLAPVAAAEG